MFSRIDMLRVVLCMFTSLGFGIDGQTWSCVSSGF